MNSRISFLLGLASEKTNQRGGGEGKGGGWGEEKRGRIEEKQ